MYDLNDSPLYRVWCPYRGKFTFLARFLLLIALIYGANLLASVPIYIGLIFLSNGGFLSLGERFMTGVISSEEYIEGMEALLTQFSLHPLTVALSMFGQLFFIVAILVYALVIERRTTSSISLGGGVKRIALSFVVGVGIGTALFSLGVGIITLTGGAGVIGAYGKAGWIVLFFFALLCYIGGSELLYRGFFLNLFIRPGRSPWLGMILTSLFSAFASYYAGLTACGIINLVLINLMMAVLTVRTGSLWLGFGIRFAWTFVGACIFGSAVDGIGGMPTVWALALSAGRELTHGGTAGLDNGLVMTLILLVALTLALFLPSWKKTRVQRLSPFDAPPTEQ